MLIDCMLYGFISSCLFSRSICAFSLTETNVGGTGKILNPGKLAVKTFQLVHKFNEKFTNAVLPSKPNGTNSVLKFSVLKYAGETAAVAEHEGTACALLSDLLFVPTPHTPLGHPL